MRFTPIVVSLCCAMLTVACSSTIRVTKYDPSMGQEGEGAVYFLPKNLLQLRFNVEMKAQPGDTCAKMLDDCAPIVEAQDLKLTDAELLSIVLPDERAGFVLESNGTFLTETEFTAHFAEVGALLDANAKSNDQIIEAVTWGAQTYGKLFTGTVMAGSSELKATQQLARRRDLILKGMRLTNETAQSRMDEGDVVGAVFDTRDDMDALREELALIESSLTTTVSLPVVCSIDPADINIAEIDGARVVHIDPNRGQTCPAYAWLQKWLQSSGLAYVPPLPALKVRLVPQASVEGSRSPDAQWHALRDAAGKTGSSWVPGLVYRIPAWFDVSVTSVLGPLLHEVIPVPQLGQLAAVTIDDQALRRDRVFEVTLYPNLGNIQELHYSLSPMDFEKATEAVDSIVEITTKRSQLETEQFQAETERLQAEIELLEMQAAHQEALEALQSPAESPDITSDFE